MRLHEVTRQRCQTVRTISGSGAKAMPVQRSTDCLAMMVNVITSDSASSDHSARYVHVVPTQPDGVDHDPRFGESLISTLSHSKFSVNHQ